MRKSKFHLFLITALQATALSSGVYANPLEGHVVAGQAAFATAGSTLTVNQASQNAIINWQGFSIGNGETTQFIQPNAASAVLNRVTGSDASAIYGTLRGNGSVYLINPNGIVVGPSGVIQTNAFVGSALDVPDADFTAGGNQTFTGNSTAAVQNLGSIEAAGGDVVLIGRQVANSGSLKAPAGTVALAAGSQVLLQPAGSSRVSILAGESDATLAHSGLIEAASAELKVNGGNPYALAVNTNGMVRATGAHNVGGRVILDGGTGNVAVEGNVEAKNADGSGGDVKVTGQKVWLAPTASLHANGTTGGNVIVKGTQSLQSYGRLSARGTHGNGGFIETSGGWFDLGTLVPDVGSDTLKGGTWFIDPYNITIVAGSGNSNIGSSSPFNASGDSAQLGVGLITTALSSGNVTIGTNAGGGQAGDIFLSTDLDFNGTGTGHTLTFNANRDITINNKIYDSVAGGDSLNLVFNPDTDADGGGAIVVKNNLATGGGNITFNGGVYLGGSSALDLTVGTGTLTFGGQTLMGNSSGVTLNAQGGNIVFSGAVDSGNSYALDPTTRTWSAALSAVKSGAGANNGDTYLATITSSLENSMATSVANGAQTWFGGSDQNVEGVWRWVAGPEGLEAGGLGRQFWQGTGSGYTVGGQYANWNTGEPNNSGGSENALQGGFGSAGKWNDLPTGSTALASVVETNLAPTNLTVNLGTGGALSFNGTVGANKALGNVTVNGSGGTTTVKGDFTSAGTVDIANPLTWFNAGKTLTANSVVTRAAVTANVADMTWVTDKADIQAAVNNNQSGGVFGLRQRTNGTAIALGNVGDATANTLELSAAELGRLNVPNVRIGSGNAGNLTITDNLAPADMTNLTLSTGGTITDNSGKTITVPGLALVAGGAITLDNAHDVDTLAIANSSANSLFTDADGFTIGSVDGINGIAASGRLVELTAGGAVGQTHAITTAGLNLLGANADWTLTNTSNNIDTLAGNTKTVNYVDSNALAIGSVNSTVGLTTSGAAQARTLAGDIGIWSPMTAGGGGNSIVLASAANFVNHLAGTALTPGVSGRYLVYSTSPLLDTLAGLTGSRRYNSSYAGYGPSSVTQSGNLFLYTLNPTLTFTADNLTVQYGNTGAYTYTVGGYVTGDSAATAFTGAPSLTPSGGGAVGTRTIVAGLGTLNNLQNYTLAYVNGTATITPAPLTITAQDFTREFAHDNPTFTATYTGLTNGDTAADITGLTLTTTATKNSAAGTYAITAAGGTNGNYNITLNPGVLTVTPFAEANNVLALQTTYGATPSSQQVTQRPVPPAPQPGGSGQPVAQNNAPVTAPVFVPVQQIGVAPPGPGHNIAALGGGDSLAHYSSLDAIEDDHHAKHNSK